MWFEKNFLAVTIMTIAIKSPIFFYSQGCFAVVNPFHKLSGYLIIEKFSLNLTEKSIESRGCCAQKILLWYARKARCQCSLHGRAKLRAAPLLGLKAKVCTLIRQSYKFWTYRYRIFSWILLCYRRWPFWYRCFPILFLWNLPSDLENVNLS